MVEDGNQPVWCFRVCVLCHEQSRRSPRACPQCDRKDDALPEIANELRVGLRDDRPDLVATLDDLELVDRCRCGDEFCATFYTVAKGAWPERDRRERVVTSAQRLICLTVADGQILEVPLKRL